MAGKKEPPSAVENNLRQTLAETSENISAENLQRVRAGLSPAKPPVFSPVPVYVAIEQALVLGSEKQMEGTVYRLEPDGTLRPIDGRDLVTISNAYPNFIKKWRLSNRD